MFVTVPERPHFRLRWATPILIAISLFCALWQWRLPLDQRTEFVRHYGTVPSEMFDGQPGHGNLSSLTRLVSALFVHADFFHLFGNLLFLTLFGLAVEKMFRSRLSLFLFLFCGVLANAVSILMLKGALAPIIGCSGAVAGLIGAYVCLFPKAKLGVVIPLGLYFELVSVPAQHLIGLWLLLQVLYTIAGPTLSAVAWITHVVGFASGFIAALIMRPYVYKRARQMQLSGRT
jgi:membrane associated rhomboid family serine protease